MAGTGWTCALPTLSCSRSDVLASGAAYPAVTLTVQVADDAGTPLTNQAQVSGGGELETTNNSASRPNETRRGDLSRIRRSMPSVRTTRRPEPRYQRLWFADSSALFAGFHRL